MGNLIRLEIGSLNCQELNDYYKSMSLFDYFRKSDLSIICLQEINLQPEWQEKYAFEWGNGMCMFNSVVGEANVELQYWLISLMLNCYLGQNSLIWRGE